MVSEFYTIFGLVGVVIGLVCVVIVLVGVVIGLVGGEKNTFFGILIITLITSVLFVIFPTGFFFWGDIHLLAGTCIGEYFTFKTRKETQKYIKLGVIVGFTGSIFALILNALLFWIFYLLPRGFDFISTLLVFLISSGIMYAMMGIIIGVLFAIGFRNRASREESPLL
ncbi:MAG: hypothetical protein EAX91_00355 [Candidatus Lokiarchaeota archaeon]|nr:hypothetical protein [Candidatus Lokiarchaeota archaeon]